MIRLLGLCAFLALFILDLNLSHAQVAYVDSDRLQDLIDTKADLVVIDVRTPDEFSESHIQGAKNIDYYDSFKAAVKDLDKEAKYVLYCRSGVRSRKSQEIMQSMGFIDVLSLEGGIEAWKNAGYPTKDR